ncbi:MAG: heme o synthase [Bacteroidota bacterium]|nr:heme o synthase [Bacteroidota bacterium]
MKTDQLETPIQVNIMTKSKAFVSLMKLRLSSLVVLSAFFGFFMAKGDLNSLAMYSLLLGGLLITGSSNGLNQLLEIKTDSMMSRTKSRPLPVQIISKTETIIFCIIIGALGLFLLYTINYKSMLLGLFSMVVYVLIYTPLKQRSAIAVFVGAIPGSIPPLLGYVAVSNDFGLEPGVLFMLQFFWQFPHFWALAWKLDEDYKKAGFRLLPSIEKNKKSAFQIMLYSAFLIPSSMLPWAAEMTGTTSMIIGICLSLIMYTPAIRLYFTLEDKYANKIMYYSFAYLPILFTVYCFDLL